MACLIFCFFKCGIFCLDEQTLNFMERVSLCGERINPCGERIPHHGEQVLTRGERILHQRERINPCGDTHHEERVLSRTEQIPPHEERIHTLGERVLPMRSEPYNAKNIFHTISAPPPHYTSPTSSSPAMHGWILLMCSVSLQCDAINKTSPLLEILPLLRMGSMSPSSIPPLHLKLSTLEKKLPQLHDARHLSSFLLPSNENRPASRWPILYSLPFHILFQS
ncbi:hypothetical protein SAMN05216225_100412 [Ornithinibacillus halophilus]|uniref:Uncharacterized protein n=1 Tax=Ornithinibacillus halophilus TaxID=930117 RepID=A0A1M5E7X6_9BACI|nr:hypothetical protein SAMN05216225_100412 [Ornithinibacillus halophilus]